MHLQRLSRTSPRQIAASHTAHSAPGLLTCARLRPGMKTFFMLTMLVEQASAVGSPVAVKGGNMCAGYDSAADDYRIYYGPCDTVAQFATGTQPMFSAGMTGCALISGADGAYLTDETTFAELLNHVPGSEMSHATSLTAGTFKYSLAAAAAGFGDRTFKRSTFPGHNNSGAQAAFATAFYLATEGSIALAYNDFPTPHDAEHLTSSICVGDVGVGTCASRKTITAGDLKFALFGMIGGTGLAAKLAAKTHLGFRQVVKVHNIVPTAMTFNGGSKTIDNIGTTSVTDFELTFAGGAKVKHTFDRRYTVGPLSDCVDEGGAVTGATAAAPDNKNSKCTPTANTKNRDLVIKAKKVDGTTVQFDYLFPIVASSAGGDGLGKDVS
jgi:hypothetical protein